MSTRFGTKLKQARESARLSLAELAVAIGASPSYLSKLERGHVKEPSAGILMGLARVFDWNLQDISPLFISEAERKLDERIEKLEDELGKQAAGRAVFAAYKQLSATTSDKRFYVELLTNLATGVK